MSTVVRAEGLIVSAGNRLTLEALLNAGVTLHLYTNPREPRRTDQFADYIEPRGGGYKPLLLDADSWTVVLDDTSPRARATHPEVEFTLFTPGLTVYGYLLLVASELYAVSPLPRPFQVFNLGDTLKVTPIIVQGRREE